MYKAVFQRKDSNDVSQEHTETNADLDALLDTVFTNVENKTASSFVEDLCAVLYEQVDGEWQERTPGSDVWTNYNTRWNTIYNS